jgi:hypothetical protein
MHQCDKEKGEKDRKLRKGGNRTRYDEQSTGKFSAKPRRPVGQVATSRETWRPNLPTDANEDEEGTFKLRLATGNFQNILKK